MKHIEKFTLITFIIIFLTYNIIGYIANIAELKFIVFNTNNGITVSFISLFVPIILSYVIYYFTNKFKIK